MICQYGPCPAEFEIPYVNAKTLFGLPHVVKVVNPDDPIFCSEACTKQYFIELAEARQPPAPEE